MDSLYGCGGSSEYGQKCNGFSVVVSNSSRRLPKSSAIAESSLPHLFWFFFRVWLLLALYSFCVGPAVADVYIQASFLMYVSKSGTLTYIQKVFVQVLWNLSSKFGCTRFLITLCQSYSWNRNWIVKQNTFVHKIILLIVLPRLIV